MCFFGKKKASPTPPAPVKTPAPPPRPASRVLDGSGKPVKTTNGEDVKAGTIPQKEQQRSIMASDAEARKASRRKKRESGGFKGTLLTGAGGVKGSASVSHKTLLGV